ncbi:conserved hypothetical protein [Sporisorium reilianum SRZ2]|uniref:CENP-V/GFA domain-containing protein n=2 Tax=Sporisorium reilianum TaxID=72558 RepID=E6ZYA4_SPORE|nr:conserved hypothetical protein [Sporisorium reilianum SRZ2]SJX62082.1 uncharacterized protein SRS1_10731 [Sporisorium reilianum f. sp. reilianum]
MPLTGSCLCGQVQVTVKDSGLPLKPAVCRCTNCQQTGGSVFSLVSILPEEHVQFTGETKSYADKTSDSGNVLQRHFCGTCGSQVQSVSPAYAGMAIIKMGLFAQSDGWDKDIEAPVAQIFTKNKKSWETLLDGVPALEAGR